MVALVCVRNPCLRVLTAWSSKHGRRLHLHGPIHAAAEKRGLVRCRTGGGWFNAAPHSSAAPPPVAMEPTPRTHAPLPLQCETWWNMGTGAGTVVRVVRACACASMSGSDRRQETGVVWHPPNPPAGRPALCCQPRPRGPMLKAPWLAVQPASKCLGASWRSGGCMALPGPHGQRNHRPVPTHTVCGGVASSMHPASRAVMVGRLRMQRWGFGAGVSTGDHGARQGGGAVARAAVSRR